MVNIECQTSSFLFDIPTRQQRRISLLKTIHDYDCPTDSITPTLARHDDLDDDNNEISSVNSPTMLTSSESSDSAIAFDELDEIDFVCGKSNKYRNSWPKVVDKLSLPISTTFASLSEPFKLLDKIEKTLFIDSISSTRQSKDKYKHPLPWLSSTSVPQAKRADVRDSSSDKVSFSFLLIDSKDKKTDSFFSYFSSLR